MFTNVCAKFNYDGFHIDKALGNFWKSDNKKHKQKNNNNNNVRSTWGPVLSPRTTKQRAMLLPGNHAKPCKFWYVKPVENFMRKI